MKSNEFYCVKCRKIVKVGNDVICFTFIKNKRVGKIPALKAECNKCETNLTKFVKVDDVEKLEKKYDKC